MYTFEFNDKRYFDFDAEALNALVSSGDLTQVQADAIISEHNAKQSASEAKTSGKEYLSTGVIVPFKSDDAMAVLQVKAAFEVGVTSTVFKFSNGQQLPITQTEFAEFAAWFAAERNAFFV